MRYEGSGFRIVAVTGQLAQSWRRNFVASFVASFVDSRESHHVSPTSTQRNFFFPRSFILHPSSFILHPSRRSFILHPSSFILRHSAFTLIELLVVIMLLTVLMLTAFPAFRGLERTTKRHRAVAEADAIAQAALAYRRTYGQWPLEDRAGLDGTETSIIAGHDLPTQHLEISQVVKVLRNTLPEHNPRKILFLELPDDRLDIDGTPLDPWHQPYVLVMARVADGNKVAHIEGGINASIARSSSATVSTTALVDGPDDVVAFSWGDPAHSDQRVRPELYSWSKR